MPAKKRSSKRSAAKKVSSKSYSSKSSYNYGKRPLWQWIVIYVILGVIVYGLIYYFVLGNHGGYNYQSPAPTTQNNYQAPTQ